MNARTKLLRAGGLALAAGTLYLTLHQPEAPAQPARSAPNYFAFVRSMDGTTPDGEVRQNSAEKLVVDAELAHLFDYYLAGLGERSLDAIRVEIGRELDRRLKPAAAAEARRLLAQYLEYKRALVDMEKSLPKPASLTDGARARLEAMQQLRHRYFSQDEIDGLFGASDAYDTDAIARMEINADTTLTPAQRQQKLAALDAKLPAALREEREAPTRVLRLEDEVQRRRAQGAGDNEIYQLRAATLSPGAADRLAELDRDQADWQRRIAAYQQQRQQLQARATPPSAAELQQLRDAGFTPLEQKRLPAYE
ncbi:lipase secretion chaperone [Rugamonas apoptosis]|uniref:Lipase helper protein n=1 Tax=Rugamonas apoptosis TaxID=2758570 RepID=A0A7W2IKK6_9BURK|nr:lipase secretion chaperone [Rugamonas apoptosis]MBA5687482.1 lipase chaperone [Rugamonas apoptosis]